MANYNTLISAIQSVIAENGNNEITGNILQQTLVAMIGALGGGYQFAGIATPSTTPGTPDEKIFYLGSSGTYPNFGPAVIPSGNMGVFWYDTSWHVGTIEFPIGEGSITKSNLSQSLLNELLNGFVYAGIATPTGNPGSPLRDSFYMTTTPGTYTNYGNLTVQDEEIAVFRYVVSTGIWSKDSIALPETTEIVNNLYEGGTGKALSAEAGKILNSKVFGSQLTRNVNDAIVEYFIDSNGHFSRVRLIYRINSIPANIQASCTLGRGVAISLYDTMEKARRADTNYIISPTNYGYVSSYTGTINYVGYLAISLAKSSGNFTVSEAEQYIAATTIQIITPEGAGGPLNELKKDILDLSGTGLTKNAFTVYQVPASSHTPSETGTRLRLVYLIPDTDYPFSLYAKCTLGKGVAVAVYNTLNDALEANRSVAQDISINYQTYVKYDGIKPGYLVISLCKSNESAFSVQDKADFLEATTIYLCSKHQLLTLLLSEEQEETNTGTAGMQPINLGTFVQKAMTSSGLTDTNASKRVSMASNIAIPYQAAVLYFILPEGIGVGIRSGNTAGNLNNNNYWFLDGSTFQFAASAHYFRLCFGKNSGDDELALADIQNYIQRGEIQIWITSEIENDIIKRNFENEKYVKSVMRNFVSGASQNGSLTKLPIFAHSSDIHGDMWRFRSMMRYCDYLGVDALLVSGDMVASTPSDSNQYIIDVSGEFGTPVLPCMGNHDANGLSTAEAQSVILKQLIDNCEGVYTGSYPTYFYKDFTSKNIRVISLNFYETDHSGHNCNFTHTQCDWFINALASTPADYGVLVMFHAPETTITKDESKANFYQLINNYWETHPGVTGNPILNIVDAFISGVSASISYTSKGVSITTTADFTNKNAGAEFIAYINGHEHIDLVGYVTGSVHKQLNLNVTCGIAIYGTSYNYLANNSDLPRGDKGATQDSFNIYSIDRAAKVVRIARLGSNISGYNLTERKYMSISYVD